MHIVRRKKKQMHTEPVYYSGTCEEGAEKDLVARVRNLGRATPNPVPLATSDRDTPPPRSLDRVGIRLDDETAPIIPPCGAAPTR